jgi:hypothetical protein
LPTITYFFALVSLILVVSGVDIIEDVSGVVIIEDVSGVTELESDVPEPSLLLLQAAKVAAIIAIAKNFFIFENL